MMIDEADLVGKWGGPRRTRQDQDKNNSEVEDLTKD